MDADGKAEFLVWRGSTGTWFWTSPTSNSSVGAAGIQWGALGDVPLLTDLDGDGRADPDRMAGIDRHMVLAQVLRRIRLRHRRQQAVGRWK